jgi:hypothetical protein
MGSWIIKTGYKSWIWRAAPGSAYEISEYIQTRIPSTSKTLLTSGKWKRRSGKGQVGSTADVEVIVDV